MSKLFRVWRSDALPIWIVTLFGRSWFVSWRPLRIERDRRLEFLRETLRRIDGQRDALLSGPPLSKREADAALARYVDRQARFRERVVTARAQDGEATA